MKAREIRDFLNTLSEEELNKVAIIMGEEDGFRGGEIDVSRLGEDYYTDDDGTNWPLSSFSEEQIATGITKIYDKDEVFFY